MQSFASELFAIAVRHARTIAVVATDFLRRLDEGQAPSRTGARQENRRWILWVDCVPEYKPFDRAPQGNSLSLSFDHRRSSRLPLTAIASARFCPTSTTKRLPRVMPV